MKIERLVFPEKGRCDIERVELDEKLQGDEVLVRTRATLISAGTELAMYTGIHRAIDDPNNTFAKYPFRPGYSAVGEVVAGALPAGTRVFWRGNHATFGKVGASATITVPVNVPDEQATYNGMLQIALTALSLTPVRVGTAVVVIGLGPVGNLAAQWFRSAGAQVFGADLSAARLARAKACGLDTCWSVAERPVTEWVKTLPAGAEVVVDAVGSTRTIADALAAVAQRGRVVMLGTPRVKMEIDPYYDIHLKGISLIGSHEGNLDPELRRKMGPVIMEWLGAGRLKVGPLISHRVTLQEAATNGYVNLRDKPEEYCGVIINF